MWIQRLRESVLSITGTMSEKFLYTKCTVCSLETFHSDYIPESPITDWHALHAPLVAFTQWANQVDTLFWDILYYIVFR